MRSLTSPIVSRAIVRQCAAPVAKASSTIPGLASISAARRRIGVSSVSIDLCSTFLQSMHPHAAVRQLTATCSTVAGSLKARWRW